MKNEEDSSWLHQIERDARTIAELRSALAAIVDAWPHVNCVCGRSAPRMSEKHRATAIAALAHSDTGVTR